MALMLFQLAVDTKAPTTADLIKSVAFLLEDAELEISAQCFADTAELKLISILLALKDSTSKVEEQVQCLEESAAMMDNVCLQFSETLDEAAHLISATTDSLHNCLDSTPFHSQPAPFLPHPPLTLTIPHQFRQLQV
jgi:hypothetical protein